MNDFREIAPTFVLFAPRVWESIAADVRARVMDSSPLKQGLYELGMKTGLSALARASIRSWPKRCCFARCATGSALPACARRRPAAPRSARTPSNSSRPWACRCARSTARPNCLAPTPCTPFGQVDPDTTGVPMADSIEIRIDNPDIHGVGEIVVRHPNMFLGYYKKPGSLRGRHQGWLDAVGRCRLFQRSTSQLVVIDRIKDLAETARGERFSPQYIENKLKFSPYIAEPWCSAPAATRWRR
jgi:long-chain acyl-CoA synthetase